MFASSYLDGISDRPDPFISLFSCTSQQLAKAIGPWQCFDLMSYAYQTFDEPIEATAWEFHVLTGNLAATLLTSLHLIENRTSPPQLDTESRLPKCLTFI